jgi:3-oxoadipate enol-lactonase
VANSSATLVLINAIGNDARSWQFMDLENAHPFEYPGHGKRPRKPGWTHDDFADEIVSHFDGMLDLFGMSMGGTIVAKILVKYPHRIRSAIIACSGSVARAVSSNEARNAHRQMILGRGRQALEHGMEAVVDQTINRWFTPLSVRLDHPGVRYARDTLLQMEPEAWNDIWTAQANNESVPLADLKEITQPVTIIGGAHDQGAGLRGLTELHQIVPNSRYEVIAGPHMMHLDQPKSLVGAIERHLAWAPIGNRVDDPMSTFTWSDSPATQEGAVVV